MNSATNVFFLYKIAKKEHLISLAEGHVYFSCCGNWANIGKIGCGKGQGDKYECVFAKYLRKNSRKPIQHYKKLFGKDLIVEHEGEYVLLKRKSSLYIPAACFYSLDNASVVRYLPSEEKERIDKIFEDNPSQNKITVTDFPINLSDDYFKEFNLDSQDIDAAMIQPREFLNKLSEKGILYNKVTYIDMSNEYDIWKEQLYQKYGYNLSEAQDLHLEMFFKDKSNYEHQCELRLICYDKSFTSIKQSLIVDLSGLSFIRCGEDKSTTNATGIDIFCYVKNQYHMATVVVERQNDNDK